MKCERCGSPITDGPHEPTRPDDCIRALRLDLAATQDVVERISVSVGQCVARVEMLNQRGDGRSTLVFYITTGLKTKDDVLAALIASQLKSVYVFGNLLRSRKNAKTPA